MSNQSPRHAQAPDEVLADPKAGRASAGEGPVPAHLLRMQALAGNRAVSGAMRPPTAGSSTTAPLPVQASFLSWVKSKLGTSGAPASELKAEPTVQAPPTPNEQNQQYEPNEPYVDYVAPPSMYEVYGKTPGGVGEAGPAAGGGAGGAAGASPMALGGGGYEGYAKSPDGPGAEQGEAEAPGVLEGPKQKWDNPNQKSVDQASYGGENLSVADAAAQGLNPRRHAADARYDRELTKSEALLTQDRLVGELKDLEKQGLAKTPAYADKLKQVMEARRKELHATKNMKDLGLAEEYEQLQQYKVKYLETEEERDPYRLSGSGTLLQGTPPAVFDTTKMTSYGSGSGWAMYAMDLNGTLYAAEHRIQRMHHSTFMAGKNVAAAGEMKVEQGRIVGINSKTGHYQAGIANLVQVLLELAERGFSLDGMAVSVLVAGKLQPFAGGATKFLEQHGPKEDGKKPDAEADDKAMEYQ